jgi:UDPglucose 6-dehydrogenase
MNIAVVGTGYVGLVAGVCFAEHGNDVICVDKNPLIVEKLSKGEPTIYEPGLKTLLERSLKEASSVFPGKSRIQFTTDLSHAVKHSTIIFIAVGTPMKEDGSCDLSATEAVAEEIAQAMTTYKIIVTKSTVPVGTGARLSKLIKERCNVDFDVVSNPEFLKEGAAIEDFMKPDCVIVGLPADTKNKDALNDTFAQLYAPFMMTGNRLIFMGRESAELTKYAANAMLATRISFMNEMARLAEKVGANVDEVRKGIGSDRRIGPSFLFAGPGYGGSCFPKDVSALQKTAEEHGMTLEVVKATEKANREQRKFVVQKVLDHYKGDIKGKTFALWGLAFKAKTDDVRMSPAIEVAKELLKMGALIQAYDPEAMHTAKAVLGSRIMYADNEYHALEGADALLLMTDWTHFRSPNFDRFHTLKDKTIFDARNLHTPEHMQKHPLSYISIGRPATFPK